jgi:aldehyde:ferredoxin oxidoreductase
MKGFFNRCLIVDASTGTSTIEPIGDDVLKRYLGGKGLSAWLLMKHQAPRIDPLSPENPFIIATGPVNDTPVFGSSRVGIYTKSPLTGIYLGSYTGGKAPEKVSRTGFDAIVILGKAPSLCYIEITSAITKFHDAAFLKGRDCHVTERALMEIHGKGAGAFVIGPAGENLLPFAIVSNDLWRCAGRGGAGAVLGSKNIKGIVFAGEPKKRELADPGAATIFARETLNSKKEHAATKLYKTKGTPMMVDTMNSVKAFPTRYWKQGYFDKYQEINSDAMYRYMDVQPTACAKCFMACGKLSTVKDGPHKGLKVEGPEYETIYAFGGLCMIADITGIAWLNDVCDRLGIDTMTAGNLVALAMEASAQGRIKEQVPYGDSVMAANLIKDIVARKGLGAILAQGIRVAAPALGMEDQAIHVKGLEPAGYDPRYLSGMGLAYATSDRGACHLRTTFYKAELSGMIKPSAIEGKADMLIDFEDRLTIFDTLVLCRFFRDFYLWDELMQIVRMTTGLDLTKDELQQIARNVSDLVKSYNIREGVTSEGEMLPARFFDEPLPETGNIMKRSDFELLKTDYYGLRGWDTEGRPKQ